MIGERGVNRGLEKRCLILAQTIIINLYDLQVGEAMLTHIQATRRSSVSLDHVVHGEECNVMGQKCESIEEIFGDFLADRLRLKSG